MVARWVLSRFILNIEILLSGSGDFCYLFIWQTSAVVYNELSFICYQIWCVCFDFLKKISNLFLIIVWFNLRKSINFSCFICRLNKYVEPTDSLLPIAYSSASTYWFQSRNHHLTIRKTTDLNRFLQWTFPWTTHPHHHHLHRVAQSCPYKTKKLSIVGMLVAQWNPWIQMSH